jgi:hypothetical protein
MYKLPLLRGELVNAKDTTSTGRELEIKTTATAVTSKVEIQNITLLGMFFLGSITSLDAKLRDSMPMKNHPANGKTFMMMIMLMIMMLIMMMLMMIMLINMTILMIMFTLADYNEGRYKNYYQYT